MKNKTLIITRFSEDYSTIIESLDEKENLIWLQLWPVLNTAAIIKNHPKLKVLKSIDFTTNDDHYKIAQEVRNISTNWWEIFGLNKFDQEWNINGLNITDIFSYEIEQILTNILYQSNIITNAIKKINPKTIYFVEKSYSNKRTNCIIENSKNYSYYEFFKKQLNKKNIVRVIDTQSSQVSHYSSFINKISSKKPIHYYRIFKRILFRLLKKKNGIAVSNGFRCLQQIEDFSKCKMHVYVHSDKEYRIIQVEDILSKEIRINKNEINSIIINFFEFILRPLQSRFFSLKKFYSKVEKYINKTQPKIFITVNMANSIELVKLWAYKVNKIRTIWSSEGLGQPDRDLGLIIDSVIRPEIDVERWVVSKFFKRVFSKNKKPVNITGYLDESMNNIKKMKTKKHILFVLSMSKPFVKRAITSEDMFEILKSLKEVSDAVYKIEDYELIIKIHPGDSSSIALYKSVLINNNRARIIYQGNINKIINNSELVIIHEGSVALEALHQNKNVIWYNYNGRKNYINSIYKYINHNPKDGAAMILVKNKSALHYNIKRLLKFSSTNNKSPGLSYVLKNSEKGYSSKKILRKLIT